MSRSAAPGGPSQHRQPDDSPGFLLWRVSLNWQRAITSHLRPLGLTHVQFVLLATVWWLAQRADARLPSQTEVATLARTDLMMTSQVLRALEARGLLNRPADAQDGRVKRLCLTPEGFALTARAMAVVEAADAEYFAAVTDQGQLLTILHQLIGDSPAPTR